MTPNRGIFEDGQAAAFLHGETPTAHDYDGPGLSFQRWSWLSGYVDGLQMRLEVDALEARRNKEASDE